jgi:hypothetical protein
LNQSGLISARKYGRTGTAAGFVLSTNHKSALVFLALAFRLQANDHTFAI